MSRWDKRNLMLTIMELLAKAGFKILGYHADQSDSMTDYYCPAYWDGRAEKNAFNITVNEYGKRENNAKWKVEKDGKIFALGGTLSDAEKIAKSIIETVDNPNSQPMKKVTEKKTNKVKQLVTVEGRTALQVGDIISDRRKYRQVTEIHDKNYYTMAIGTKKGGYKLSKSMNNFINYNKEIVDRHILNGMKVYNVAEVEEVTETIKYIKVKPTSKKAEVKTTAPADQDGESFTTKNNEVVKVVFNEKFKNYDLFFNAKPSTETLNQIKAIDGKRYYFKLGKWTLPNTEETQEFLNNLTPAGAEAPTEEQTEEVKSVPASTPVEDAKEVPADQTEVKKFNIEEQGETLTEVSTKLIEKYQLKTEDHETNVNYLIGIYNHLEENNFSSDEVLAIAEYIKSNYGFYGVVATLEYIANNLIKYTPYSEIKNLFSMFNNVADNISYYKKRYIRDDLYYNNVKVKGITNPIIKSVEDKNIIITALEPALNKNDWKTDNDKEIAEKSYIQKCLITDIVKLDKESYNYFCFNLLEDCKFLTGKGGSCKDEETGEIYRLAVAVYTEGEEVLIVDPQGHTYARYTLKLIEDINGDLQREIGNTIKIDNELFYDSLSKIKNENLYIYSNGLNGSLVNKVKTDNRLIYDKYNERILITGLTYKEMLSVGYSVKLGLNELEATESIINYIKHYMLGEANGTILTLFEPKKANNGINLMEQLSRLDAELLRASEYEQEQQTAKAEESKIINLSEVKETITSVPASTPVEEVKEIKETSSQLEESAPAGQQLEFIIDTELIRRANDNNFIASDTDYQKELNTYFGECDTKIDNIINNTDNQNLKNEVLKYIADFKERYFKNYIAIVKAKAEIVNPFKVGRGKLGKYRNKQDKAQKTQSKLFTKNSELINEFNNKIYSVYNAIGFEPTALKEVEPVTPAPKKAKANITKFGDMPKFEMIEIYRNTEQDGNVLKDGIIKVKAFKYDNYFIIKNINKFSIYTLEGELIAHTEEGEELRHAKHLLIEMLKDKGIEDIQAPAEKELIKDFISSAFIR